MQAREECRAIAAGNVFLIGLMGVGKTTVGKLLAHALGKAFVDSDHEIVRRTGVAIPVIFNIEGEAGFRAREARVIDELTQCHNIVLATGGGAVLREENRQRLRCRGTVIYLRARAEALLQRTRYDRNRPLLQTDDRLATLTALFAQRDPLYRKTADIVLNADGHNPHHLIRQIEKRLSSCRFSLTSDP